MYRSKFFALLTVALLQACNSDNTKQEEAPALSEYERLRQEAALKSAEVESLVSATPCTQSSQCSSLVLQPQLPPCFFNQRYDYSLVSPTASAASAAAAAYNTLSAQAYAIQPPSNVSGSCFQNVDLTPLNCVANKCVRQFVFVGPPVTGPQPEGIWVSGALQVFISFVDSVWAVDTSASTPTIYTGTLIRQGTNLTATLDRISGSVASVSGLNATISDTPVKSITIERLDGFANIPSKLDASTDFFSPSTLNQVAGIYDLSTGERIVLESNGTIRSSDLGCTVTGGFDATWSDRNVYRLGVVFGPAPCKNPNAFVEGILAPLPGGRQFLAAKRRAPDVAAVTMTRLN